MKVAIQGYQGSFHHIVAVKYFGEGVEIVPCASFRALSTALTSGQADRAVMAIENSIAGSILPNYKILQNSQIKVTGEYNLEIVQNLMALRGTRLEHIVEVQSHPMALLQCTDFLDTKGWRLVETEDTALSAQHVAQQSLKGVAAVAGDMAAELFGLEIIAAGINTIKNNHTRFLVLERAQEVIPEVEDADKASMFFELSHQRGSLVQALMCVEFAGLNMTKLQSYPIPEDPFTYLFHLDAEFASRQQLEKCVEQMKNHCRSLHLYGIYKKAE